MTRDGLVELPENALVEERIAFGLTAPQLAIVAAAVLLAGALNLLPLWAPLKALLILVLSGGIAAAAALPIHGEPAYRWIVRAARYWRSPKTWRAAVRLVSKPTVSGDAIDEHDTVEEHVPKLIESPAHNEWSAASTIVAPPPPVALPATASSVPEEQRPMDGSPVRLRLIRPEHPAPDSGAAPLGEEQERPPSIPYVLPTPRVACFVSFVGGVGKTTLAVETAALIASHARYRTADGAAHAVRVLLLDASRLSAAAGLRLGVGPEALSRAWSRRDWSDPRVVRDARATTDAHVDVITLPPHPQLAGHERQLSEAVSEEFEPPGADAVRNGAHDAGYQMVLVDLGTVLEPGHRRLLDMADVVVGIVRPTLESLPDVLRLTSYLRALDMGRKLVLVANQCDEDAELRALAREAGVPLVATVPVSPAFTAAADRHRPASQSDPRLRSAILPLARCIWPLDTLDRPTRAAGLSGLVRRTLRLERRRD